MTALAIPSPFGSATYRKRRTELCKRLASMNEDFTALFWSGSEIYRNNDTHFPFRANSDFLYLTGFSEPDCLILLQKKGKTLRTSIGVRPRDLSPNRGSEIWEGERLGVERAPSILGFDEAFDIHDLEKTLNDWLPQTPALFWSFGMYPEWDKKLIDIVNKINPQLHGLPIIHTMSDPRTFLHEQRKVKSSEEVEIMRRSASIASIAHIRAMKTTRPGHYEYQVAAEVEREFKKGGASYPAYKSIVAGGGNACTLHYSDNRKQLEEGELLLIDAGCEYEGYASDITRCYPVSGKFSPEQKEVYEWVLKAQMAAIKAVKPGVSFMKPHEEAIKVLSEGLSKMKIVKGSPQQILENGGWKAYMPHGTSHWLGLDVHDAGGKKDLRDPQKPFRLEVGNVFTVEPGLYFRLDDKKVPKQYRGIGVRIEDDVLVTRNGYEVLTKDCPKTVAEIERLCSPRL